MTTGWHKEGVKNKQGVRGFVGGIKVQKTTYLLHLYSPHGSTNINDKHNVFRKRREVGRSEELDKMAIGDLKRNGKGLKDRLKNI